MHYIQQYTTEMFWGLLSWDPHPQVFAELTNCDAGWQHRVASGNGLVLNWTLWHSPNANFRMSCQDINSSKSALIKYCHMSLGPVSCFLSNIDTWLGSGFQLCKAILNSSWLAVDIWQCYNSHICIYIIICIYKSQKLYIHRYTHVCLAAPLSMRTGWIWIELDNGLLRIISKNINWYNAIG